MVRYGTLVIIAVLLRAGGENLGHQANQQNNWNDMTDKFKLVKRVTLHTFQ